MTANTEYLRVRRWLPIMAGLALIGTTGLVHLLADEAGVPWPLRMVLVVFGCGLVALGVALPRGRFGAALATVSLAVLSASLAFLSIEVICRLLGFDFNRFNEPGPEVPICYRAPTLHAGEGIFRRPGPASWRGRPLCAYLRLHKTSEAPYADERPVVVQYDALGFRNPPDLTDWDVVVTGDSFVEQGYLPYEDLFTTLAAKRLGLRIKNLGVSCTGPLSQTFYVKHYGKAASTKDAVLCFFEGNDLKDLDREARNIESFRVTGQPFEHRKQVSFMRALCEQLAWGRRAAALALAPVTPNAVLVLGPQELPTNHWFGVPALAGRAPDPSQRAVIFTVPPPKGGTPNASSSQPAFTESRMLPMTVGVNPPAWDRLSPRQQEAVAAAMTNWATTVRASGMRPWVMCIPDSHRVFHGHLRYADPNGPFALWQPGPFAPCLAKVCASLNVAFIDPFPALRRAVEAGHVPYNLVGDNHLNVEGSRVVAEVLAEALRK